MRNLGRCVLGFLAVVSRQPGGAQLIPFKPALGCVRAHVDFYMIEPYRSHPAETITYMEDYRDTFHKMKDIFLEFRVVGNHAARHTLRILPLSLDSFRERALPSGIRRLRTRAWEASGSGVSLYGRGEHFLSRNVAIRQEVERL